MMTFRVSTVTPGVCQILVTFSSSVVTPGASIDEDNYVITPVTPTTAVSVESISVSTTDDTYSLLVETTDFTKDQDYLLTITPGVIHNIGGSFLIAPNNTGTFTATSASPVIQRIYAVDDYTIRVEFSKDMAMLDLDNKAKYQFDNDLRVIKAAIISNALVEITTSYQTPSQAYTLEIVA